MRFVIAGQGVEVPSPHQNGWLGDATLLGKSNTVKKHTDHSLGSGFANIKCDTDCGIVAVPNTHCSNNPISRHSGGEAQLFKTSKILRIGQIAANLQCFPCEGVDLQELTVTTKTAQIHYPPFP
jgi:hypothetical protein